jgi:hypothetical protein
MSLGLSEEFFYQHFETFCNLYDHLAGRRSRPVVRPLPTHDSTILNKRAHILASFGIRSSDTGVRVADTVSSDREPIVVGLFLMTSQNFLQITYHILLIQL